MPVSCSHPIPSADEMSDAERYLLDKFSAPEFTEKFFTYLSLETKAKQKFTTRNYTMFKVMLCRFEEYASIAFWTLWIRKCQIVLIGLDSL